MHLLYRLHPLLTTTRQTHLGICLWITGSQITGTPIRSLRRISGLSQTPRIPRLRINRWRPRVASVTVAPYWPCTTIWAPQKVHSQQILQLCRRYHRVSLWIYVIILFNYIVKCGGYNIGQLHRLDIRVGHMAVYTGDGTLGNHYIGLAIQNIGNRNLPCTSLKDLSCCLRVH